MAKEPAGEEDGDSPDDARITVRIPAEMAKNLRAACRRNDESVSRMFRRAVRTYLKEGPRQLDLEDAIRAAPDQKPAVARGRTAARTSAKPKKAPTAKPRRR